MRHASLVGKSLVLLVATYFAASVVSAQNATVTIAGTAQDESGAVLPGVTVTAVNLGTGQQFTATTDSQGQYRVDVPIGIYSIRGTTPGFGVVEVKNVQATIGQAVRVDLRFSGGGPLPPTASSSSTSGSAPPPPPAVMVTRLTFNTEPALNAWLGTFASRVLFGIVSEGPNTSLFLDRPKGKGKKPTYTIIAIANRGDIQELETLLKANKSLTYVGLHQLIDPVALVVLRHD